MGLHSLVSRFFKHQSAFVVAHSAAFIVTPLTVAALLCLVAFYDRPKTNVQPLQHQQNLKMFLPDRMESLKDLSELMRLFPPRDALRDSYSMFGSKFAYVIFEDIGPPTDLANVLSRERLSEVALLHRDIVSDVKTSKGTRFSTVCHRERAEEQCFQHPIQYALEDSDAFFAIQILARYPSLQIADTSVDNAPIFGGVRFRSDATSDQHGNRRIDAAAAIRLVYALDAKAPETDAWIDAFLRFVAERRNSSIENGTRLYYTSSASLSKEMERNGELLLPYTPYMFVALTLFCCVSCCVVDRRGVSVASQPLVGVCALLNALMAVVASTATLILADFPFLHMVLIMPFLILSIGVDNMFLMLRSWRLKTTGVDESRRGGTDASDALFVGAVADVSVSIFVSSLTDIISFSIGVFCAYCTLATLYMYLLQCTFFVATMALCCRREFSARHCFAPCLLMGRNNAESSLFSISRPAESTSSRSNSSSDHVASSRTSKRTHSVSFLHGWPWRAMVLTVYLSYLGAAIHWILRLPIGLDLKLLTPDDSYVAEELRAQERLFADYGAYCFCVILVNNSRLGGVDNADILKLHTAEARQRLLALYNRMTSGPLVSKGNFWLESFTDFEREHYASSVAFDGLSSSAVVSSATKGDLLDASAELVFYSALADFLRKNMHFRSDLRLSAASEGRVEALNMRMRVRQLGAVNDAPRADFLRRSLRESRLSGFVYDTSFLLVDQQSITRRNVIANVCVATTVMLTVSVAFAPRWRSALILGSAIASINIGVVGTLSALGTRLDIVSMITIVMSIGFSVDYTTHVIFHFLVHYDTDHHRRVEKTLEAIAVPITQSALSTAIGVAVLMAVPSYIVRTFVHTVLLVVIIGGLHALVFLPVALDCFMVNGEHLDTYVSASFTHLNTEEQRQPDCQQSAVDDCARRNTQHIERMRKVRQIDRYII